MSLFKEFKEFISRGNVVDLAVGVIIMPPIGVLLGGMNFSSLRIILKQATTDPTGKVVEAVSINYGNFIQTGIDFVIIAAAIFIFVKAFNSMKRKEEAPPPAPPTKEEILLTEIRDLLAKKS